MRTAGIFALLVFVSATQAQTTQPRLFKFLFSKTSSLTDCALSFPEDHSAPTYAISVTYNVGSHNERAGRTGFAHLFEHMMFQGSENVGKGEHMILVEHNGGNMNGTRRRIARIISSPSPRTNWTWVCFWKRTACARW